MTDDDHAVGCRYWNTGCAGDCDCRVEVAEPDVTIGEAIAALLDLLWRVITLGPRLVAMTAIALAETLRP